MSNFKKLYYPLVAVQILAPVVALAQNAGTVNTIIQNVSGVLNLIIGILFVLATIIFLWGVIQFIASSGSEEGRKKAKGIMTWGIIGLAVMAAAWGVANILVNFFGADRQAPRFVEPPIGK